MAGDGKCMALWPQEFLLGILVFIVGSNLRFSRFSLGSRLKV
jgi:hypothetical protein